MTYPRGQPIVAVGVSLDPEVTRQCPAKASIDLDYEWMERFLEFSMKPAFSNCWNKVRPAAVLEGMLTSQP